MSIRLASFSTFLALYFSLLAPTSLPAQELGPDQLDITGIKLGISGGPELKKEIESKPEGYICEDLIFDVGGEEKLLGYSCRAPKAKIIPHMEWSDVDYHLVTLFDQDSGKVWFIARREKLKEDERPTKKTMQEAFTKRYGQPDAFGKFDNTDEFRWIFDRTGKKDNKNTTRQCSYESISSNRIKSMRGEYMSGRPDIAIPSEFSEICGVMLNSDLLGPRVGTEVGIRENAQIWGYTLTLFDSREQYDRLAAEAQVEKEKQAEIERQKKAIPAPSF